MNQNYQQGQGLPPGHSGSGLPGQKLHHLLGRFDLDPGDWRPLWYPVEILVPVGAGGIGTNSLSIVNMPYIWTGVAHKIIGNTADPETSGLYQDGMYDIKFADEQTAYQRDFCASDLMFGAAGAGAGGQSGGFVQNMPYPIGFAGNVTLTFDIRNRVARVVGQEDYFTVQIVLHGISSWGKARAGRP